MSKKMSAPSHVSLIDLSQQMPFEIDDNVKKELCFGETLIVSCGHYEGDIDDNSTESEWTCRETTSTEFTEERKETEPMEVKEYVEPEAKPEEEEEEIYSDFQFFFFPDCKKPLPPKSSKDSVIMVDGLPQMSPAKIVPVTCSCKKNKKGECDCFTKIPCACGATEIADCTCHKLKDICVCQPGDHPQLTCICKTADVCTCDPDGQIKPICTCDKIDKPCICPHLMFPSPVCKCKHKPKLPSWKMAPINESVDSQHEEAEEEEMVEQDPCICQQPDPEPICTCLKGAECICKKHPCVCSVQHPCICDPVEEGGDLVCKDDEDTKSVCVCEIPKVCTCEDECKCYATKAAETSAVCECKEPCICDAAVPVKPKVCTCKKSSDPSSGLSDIICTCPKDEHRTLKKVRAGKEGYRWCHDVDPKHTYFDFGYGRHEKIEKKEPEPEKLVIQGLHEENNEEEEVCAVHGVQAPKYEKKVRKPSLDCCSAVGGISINVETLGEDKDKFLVQVVSHSSKEGAATGSKLVTILDSNLHTMEENRTEHITKKNLTKEKRNYMAICANGYFNRVTRLCGDKDVVKRFYHSFEKAQDFLLEGANIVLLRYIGLRRFRGHIKTNTVMMDGTICESIYVSHGVSQAIVNGTPLFVVKVERHVIEPTGFIHQTLTVLTLRGHIVNHEWADNCYMLHINPLLTVIPEKDEIEPHAPLRAKWRDDLQLLSDYLDFKTVRTSEGGRYVTESGVLTGAVRDYLQAILLLRPQDTLQFTRHYFGAVFSALDLPHDDYFDPTSKHVRYYFFAE